MKLADIEKAVEKRYPEAVALVVCQDKKGMTDVTPVSWFMLCNAEPKCWAISLNKKRYSHKIIAETGEFTLCFPSFAQKEDVLYCGNVSGWQENKLKKCKLKTLPSKKVKPPIIKDSFAGFECKVVKKTTLPDHTIFFGEVLLAYLSDRKDKIYNLGNRRLVKG